MSSIGILGGSFDPVHRGHIAIGKAAMEEFELSKVILLPAKVSPFKIGREMARDAHRVNMLRLAISGEENFKVSTFEINGAHVSYTYKTLKALKKEFPTDKLYFIMGTDSLIHLESWYKGKDLLREFSFIIGTRPGFNKEEVNRVKKEFEVAYNADINLLHNQVLDVSSTHIKNNIKEGKSIEEFLSPKVWEYINDQGLYK